MDKTTINTIAKLIDMVLKFIQAYGESAMARSKKIDKACTMAISLLLLLLIVCGFGGSAWVCIQIILFSYMQFLGLSVMMICLFLSFGNLLLMFITIWLFFKLKRILLSSMPFN